MVPGPEPGRRHLYGFMRLHFYGLPDLAHQIGEKAPQLGAGMALVARPHVSADVDGRAAAEAVAGHGRFPRIVVHSGVEVLERASLVHLRLLLVQRTWAALPGGTDMEDWGAPKQTARPKRPRNSSVWGT